MMRLKIRLGACYRRSFRAIAHNTKVLHFGQT